MEISNRLTKQDLRDAMDIAMIDFNNDSDSVILMICKSHLAEIKSREDFEKEVNTEYGHRLIAIKSELMYMQGDTVEASQAETHSNLVARLLTVLETGRDRYGRVS